MNSPAIGDRDLVFYDGECALCHATVRFLSARDEEGERYIFAPIGGDTFGEVMAGEGDTFGQVTDAEDESRLPDSIIVRTTDDRVLVRSTAVAHLLSRLTGPWPAVASALSMIPRPVRDFGYDVVARVRRRLLRKPDNWCPVVPPEQRERFWP